MVFIGTMVSFYISKHLTGLIIKDKVRAKYFYSTLFFLYVIGFIFQVVFISQFAGSNVNSREDATFFVGSMINMITQNGLLIIFLFFNWMGAKSDEISYQKENEYRDKNLQ